MVLSAVQNKLFALVQQKGDLDEQDVLVAMSDLTVKGVIIKNLKNKSI